MENEFLNGIDEHFLRLMKKHGNGKRHARASSNGEPSRTNGADRLSLEIMDLLNELSGEQKAEILEHIRSLTNGTK